MNYTPLLLALDNVQPSTLLGIWLSGCLTATGVGLIIAARINPADTSDPFAQLPSSRIGDLTDRSEARHADGGMTRWRPQHTRAAARRRGRHFTGDREWLGNLLEETQACGYTVDDLEASRG